MPTGRDNGVKVITTGRKPIVMWLTGLRGKCRGEGAELDRGVDLVEDSTKRMEAGDVMGALLSKGRESSYYHW